MFRLKYWFITQDYFNLFLLWLKQSPKFFCSNSTGFAVVYSDKNQQHYLKNVINTRIWIEMWLEYYTVGVPSTVQEKNVNIYLLYLPISISTYSSILILINKVYKYTILYIVYQYTYNINIIFGFWSMNRQIGRVLNKESRKVSKQHSTEIMFDTIPLRVPIITIMM